MTDIVPSSLNPTPLLRFLGIVAKLRDPNGGCPWDLEQTHDSLTPYVIEEAHEVVDAIHNAPETLPKELGDLLLQVALHCQIAMEQGRFDFNTVVELVSEKLIRRHPHVFGDLAVSGSKQVLENWEKIKQKELAANQSVLDGVPRGMPALLRAQRIGEKAARIGFDWGSLDGVKAKVLEEVREFIDAGSSQSRTEEEFGDLLFSLAQYSRKAGLNAEDLLQKATDKFAKRFKRMESLTQEPLSEMSMDALDALWEQVKSEKS